jgi:nonsense-mediated mRNA decay protein 3
MPSQRFCFLCGNVGEKLYKGMCETCFIDEEVEVILEERIEAKLCKGCGAHYSGGWKDRKGLDGEIITEIANREIEKNLKHNLLDLQSNVAVLSVEEKGNRTIANLRVDVKGEIFDLLHRTSLETQLELIQELCPNCTKQAGRYYESILQIRSESWKKLRDEALKVLNEVHKKDRTAFLSEETVVRGGVDFKIGSSKASRAVATYFKTHYGAEIKESKSLMEKKEGKNIYRTTVLIRA